MRVAQFNRPITAKALNESLEKRFGETINVDAFSTEQLQDARNKLRTKVQEFETNESFDAVQGDEYQKTNMFLKVINQAIEERSNIIEADIEEDATPTTVKEGAEEAATLVMAAKDMVDRITGWMEDTAEMQAESMLELGDAIRDEMGQAQSDSFIGAVKPALEGLYTALESTRGSLTGGVALLTGEGGAPAEMGSEEMPAEEPEAEMEPTVDAEAEVGGDEFAAAEPAAGGEEEAGREKRESVNNKLNMLETSRRLGTILSKKK